MGDSHAAEIIREVEENIRVPTDIKKNNKASVYCSQSPENSFFI